MIPFSRKSARGPLACVLVPAALLAAHPAARPAAQPADTASYAVDTANSSVVAGFRLSGVPASGQFKKFGGSAQFDPAHPDRTTARLEVDTASLDLGEADYNAELGKSAWFDAARYPKASFVTKAVRAGGPGKLDVTGTLTLKGRSQVLNVPMRYRAAGQGLVFEGVVPIRRLAFGIGEGEWKDTGVLEDEVGIRIRLVLVPRK